MLKSPENHNFTCSNLFCEFLKIVDENISNNGHKFHLEMIFKQRRTPEYFWNFFTFDGAFRIVTLDAERAYDRNLDF